MKWPWNEFGVNSPDPNRIKAVFAEVLPPFEKGLLKIAATSCDFDLLKVAVIGPIDSSPIDAADIERICLALSVNRVHVVPWCENLQVFVASALTPANVERVLLRASKYCAIALVREEQLPMAVGPKAQNTRLASKLCSCDIDIMTVAEFEEQQKRSLNAFAKLDGVTDDLAARLVERGFLTYDDLLTIDSDVLQNIGELMDNVATQIMAQARMLIDDEMNNFP